MKKYIVILLILSNLYTHHCNSMETMLPELVKEILLCSITSCPDSTAGRTVLLSIVPVCKQWHKIINTLSKAEYTAIITTFAQKEHKNPASIAALMGTQQAAVWLSETWLSNNVKGTFSAEELSHIQTLLQRFNAEKPL